MRKYATILLFVAAVATALVVNAGSLTPPGGAVSPTMKDLDTVEPRVPLPHGGLDDTHVISQSGSYYLTGDIIGPLGSCAITIDASNVTLDLMGFTVIGTSGGGGSLCGIRVTTFGSFDVTIVNGKVRNFFDDGIDLNFVTRGRVERVEVALCTRGIVVNGSSIVSQCTVTNSMTDGIVATGSQVSNCVTNLNGRDGIVAASSRVSDCVANSNIGDGIEVSNDCVVTGNLCSGNAPAGIHVTGSDNRIDSNHVTDNTRGIDVDAAGNVIIRNTASQGVNYDVVGGNDAGPVGSAAASTSPWTNLSF